MPNKLTLAPVKKFENQFYPSLVFGTYPQLRSIWDTDLAQKDLAQKAEEATNTFQMDATEPGEVFLILLDNVVIGITGYWPISDTMVGLRWHGILEKYRGNDYGGQALDLLCSKLTKGSILYEVAFTKAATSYFKSIGFELVLDRDIIKLVLESAGGGVYVLQRPIVGIGV